MSAPKASRLIPGRYPAPGTSSVADSIRARRGERGITPLDAALLHVPPIAAGWNSLLGAVRTQGNLPGDVRELMVGFFPDLSRSNLQIGLSDLTCSSSQSSCV
jgi:hypothetical protein